MKVIQRLLSLSLFVSTIFATPDWSVNPADYQYNGSVTSKVFIDGNEVGSSDDMVAAFVDGEVRGVINGLSQPPFLGGGYAFYLMVFSNSPTGETVNFKYYDSANNEVLDMNETLEFVSDMTLGTASDPFMLSGESSSDDGGDDGGNTSGCDANVSTWSVNPSSFQYNGSVTAKIEIDGIEVGADDDLLAAFVNDEIRGVIEATALPVFLGGGYAFYLMIFSNEVSGESLSFKYYDSSNNQVYCLDETLVFTSDMTIGTAQEPQWLTGSSGGGGEDIYGCMDSASCNYNADATIDDESCTYPDDNYDCDGNCLVETDCLGMCGGTASLDNCGSCDYDTSNDCTQDCNGEWGGNAEVDECGICGGNGIPSGDCDCDGNILDCTGFCGGSALVDSCGVCEGNNLDDLGCGCFEDAPDECGTCDGSIVDLGCGCGEPAAEENFDCDGNCVVATDCAGECGGSTEIDECGECGGDNSTCLDCAGVPNGNSTVDMCGVCDSDTSNDCSQDCNGEWGGTADIDECGVCDGPGFTYTCSDNSMACSEAECGEVYGCTNMDACNYDNTATVDDGSCEYATTYYLDTDGDGLGSNGGQAFCEDPGENWVTNNDDMYPNCASNFMDACGLCDGDDTSCTGCTDPAAAYYCDECTIDDGSCIYIPEEFLFNQSTEQAFYFVMDANIDGEILVEGEDWIGAFNGDICIGAREWRGEFTDVPAMGDDGYGLTDGYMSTGDVANFKIYDASADAYYPAESPLTEGWIEFEYMNVDYINVNPDCYGTLGGDAFIDDCGVCSGGESGHEANSDDVGCGCFEPAATSYWHDTDGDGLGAGESMEYCLSDLPVGWVDNNDDSEPDCVTNDTDDCGICAGENTDMDCSGECFGSTVIDECGECGGDNSTCSDCAGVPNGDSLLDNCGTCDNDASNDCEQDCAGEWGGTAEEDMCAVCDDDPSNDCIQDCNGNWGGDAVVDECGTCDSDPLNDCVQDCAGVWGGSSELDDCGVCDGANADMDCSGECFGTTVIDDCGECGGDNSTCSDCAGVPNGDSLLDNCGTCDNDPLNDCVQDCAGVWGGLLELDDCGVCDGGNADMDCSGECFGTAVIDECGECGGDGINEGECDCEGNVEDCFGECGGSASLDDCGVCNGGNADQDCTGECFGTALIDDCGICAGDNADMDCNGDCFGSAFIDDCDVCSEGDTGLDANADDLGCGCFEPSAISYWVDSDGDGLGAGESVDYCLADLPDGWVDNNNDSEPDCATNDTDECGICAGTNDCFGCTDGSAWNYDIDATIDDGSCLYTPNGFEFEQSTMQAFYFIESANIDGEELVAFEDWIGIFNGDICVGSYLWEGAFTTVPAMGNDGDVLTTGYMQAGDYPTFKIFDASSNMAYGASSSNALPSWSNFEFYTVDQLDGFSSVSMSLDLHFGANLVSMYTLPEDLGIGNIMSSLEDNVNGVIGEGVAANRLPTGNWVGSLQEVSPLSGYWIMMNTADEFQLNGSLTDPNSVFSLHYGANLLSYPFEGSASITETLPDGEESFINGIIGEGVAANQIEPGWWVGSLQTLQGGSGYWFIVDDAFDFSYIPPVAGMARAQSEVAISSPPSGFEYVQSTQQAFYFINEIEGVKSEDWIIAYNGNTIIGSRQWNGQYTDVPAMGYDANVNSAGYCEVGDNVRFKLYQTETGKLLDLHSTEAIQNWSQNGMVTVANMTTVEIPADVSLMSAYPNPFNPSTEIQFTIPVEMDVKVEIVNMQGRQIETLIDRQLMDGYHHVTWNASSHASGVYFVRLNTGGEISVQKILLMK